MILITFQKGPNGTHQLVAALNGRSMSPNQEMAETTANLVTLEKPFEDNDVSADSSSQHQLCKDAILYLNQRYTYRVLQTIQLKLILLWVWAEWAELGRAKTALKFKYEI